MADLTPDEQKFFETGEMQPSMTPPVEDGPPDPLALAALGKTAPVEDEPAKEPVVEVKTEPVVNQQDPAAILQALTDAQRQVGQLEQALQQAQKPVVEEPAAPDPNTDPLGAMMHQLATVNKTVAALQEQLQQQQTHQASVSQFQAFQQQVRSLRDDFAKTTVDFPDAYAHLRTAREADLKAYGLNDAQVRETLFREEATLAEAAIKQGRNPAEALYEMSKRHGYAPKAVSGTPTPPATKTPSEKLTHVANAQNAARNLPKTPVNEDITLEGLKEASDSDLNKLVLDDKSWGRIVGRDQYPL